MRRHGVLLNCDEALRFLDQVSDPVTHKFLTMAFVHAVKKTQLEQQEAPDSDFDMLFFVTVLKEFFSEHQVLAQTLVGEKVGAWFDDAE